MSEPERDPRARMRTKLLVDVGLFVAFAFVSAPQFTGLLWHEWLSLAFIPVFLVHVLLSWSWIVRVVKRFAKRLGGETRFNSLFDLFSFGLMTFVIFSGVLASREALPSLLEGFEDDIYWMAMHQRSSDLLLIVIGVHVGLHWNWIVRAFKRVVGGTGQRSAGEEGAP